MEDRDIQAIAQGRQPTPWEATFTHPVYGELTFSADLPTVAALTVYAKAVDEQLADTTTDPSFLTANLIGAIAGIRTLIRCPIVREDRRHDEDGISEKVVKVAYDPAADIDEGFPLRVWRSFSDWRQAFLAPDREEQLKNSFGETGGNDSGTSSEPVSASPSTTLA